MLQLLSEIHIRFFREMQDFPDACAEVEDQELDNDKGPKAWEDAAARLVKIPDCDLMDLALLWKTISSPLLLAQRGKTLKGLWHFHNKANKHTTRIEEDEHAKNKAFIGGTAGKPRTCVHQAASSISARISHNFSEAGGRALALPPPSLRQMWANARRATVYSRLCVVGYYLFRRCLSDIALYRCHLWDIVAIGRNPSDVVAICRI